MDTVKDNHELAMMELKNETAEEICYNNATAELVGAQAQTVRIDQAILEQQRQLVELENMKNETRLLVDGFASTYRTEVERPASPLVVDLWLDEKVDRAHDKMREAKRVAWLALRALEYETQGDFSNWRFEILSARTPYDLDTVLGEMRNHLATRTLHGGSAGQLLAVVSFRDDVMQLVDESEMPGNWHRMTPEERLQHVLTHDDYAYYEDGNYAGQRIPFTLAPIASDGLEGAIVIPLRTATDCAERLWSLNASLVGEDLNEESDTTFARVLVEQRNTFSSQWCVPEDNDSDMQTMATRPLRNLFSDPMDADADPYQSLSGDQDFTRARLSAYFDVTRSQLEDEAYFNGDSLELAGRGLYGDYALLFPIDEIVTDSSEAGVALDRVDDVMLRFDYLSVAK